MKTIEYRFVDKSEWGDGPWQNEPDKIQWPDEATGLPCLIVRQPEVGHLCGYVGVPEGHPYFGVEAEHVEASVHRGLNFANFCQRAPDGSEYSICHIVELGENDRVWWLGFDCGGGMKTLVPLFTSPSMLKLGLPPPPASYVYYDVEYVKREVGELARQLAAAAHSHHQAHSSR